jgi:hypothetical protein
MWASSFKTPSPHALKNLTITFTGEQWRRENNGSTHQILTSYSLVNTSLVSGVYTFLAALTFNSPVVGATSPVGLDGNNSANRSTLTTTIPGLQLDPGVRIMIRFTDVNDFGNDHTLAIDDFSFSAEAVPEPATLCIFASAIGAAAFRQRRK